MTCSSLSPRERDELVQVAVADDHARRVDAGAAGQPLEHGREFPHLPGRRLGFDGLS